MTGEWLVFVGEPNVPFTSRPSQPGLYRRTEGKCQQIFEDKSKLSRSCKVPMSTARWELIEQKTHHSRSARRSKASRAGCSQPGRVPRTSGGIACRALPHNGDSGGLSRARTF